MNFFSRITKRPQPLSPGEVFKICLNSTPFHFFLFIAIWVFCFRDFIFGQLPFDSDAGAYYGHIKLYTENLMKGIYPLWDPSLQAPTEFFMRRFDSFNPIIFLIIILKTLRV